MKVTARFVCASVTDFGGYGKGEDRTVNLQIKMNAIWTGHPEDNNYSKATPNGDLTMQISNPALDGHFKPGDVYDITIVRHVAPPSEPNAA